VCQCLSMSVTTVSPSKTVESIKMPFGGCRFGWAHGTTYGTGSPYVKRHLTFGDILGISAVDTLDVIRKGQRVRCDLSLPVL